MKFGKYKLWIMTFFLVLFFVLLVLFLVTARDLSFGVWFVLGLIIVNVIVVSVIGYVYQKRISIKLEALSKPYQETYLNAVDLINIGTINPKDRSETKSMILEIFEHADLEKRDVNEVIGNDINAYVNNFLQESKQRNTLLSISSHSIMLFLIFLLFMKFYKVVRHANFNNAGFESEVLDMGIILTYALISFVFYPSLLLLIQKSAKEQWQGAKRLIVLIPTIIPMGLFMLLIFINNDNLRSFLDQEVMIFGSVYAFFLGIIIEIVLYIAMGFIPAIRFKK